MEALSRILQLIEMMKKILILSLLLFIFESCNTQKHGQVYKAGSTCRKPSKRYEVHQMMRM